MGDRLLAVLGRGMVPADTPVLCADDLGVLRGDGVFEVMHVRAGRPWLWDEHVARLARSAGRLDLELPGEDTLAELVAELCAAWPQAEEGTLRLVCTRGVEAGAAVTVFATVQPVGAGHLRARRDGIAVATASLGYPADARQSAPWLLGGVKSLSYAVNMASLRWAAQQGVDDALWVSTDGWALEAPTATLVWLAGDALCTVPPERTGVLPGCTAGWLLAHAGELGFHAQERMIRPADLAGTDGAWLTSSGRGLAEIRALDGVTRPASAHTERLRELLGFGV